MVRKTDFDTKLSLNQKTNSNKTKHLPVENEFKKLKRVDLSCFNFGTQNYLVFQLMYPFGNTDYVLSWKSKGLSDETIKSPSTSDNSLAPSLSYYDTKTRVNFTGS